MKILINPEWLSIVRDLSTEQKAEILTCLFSYPAHVETESGIWEYMRKQIDRDTEKYQVKVRTLSDNRQKRWDNEQKDNRNVSETQQTGDRNTTDDEQNTGQKTANSVRIDSSTDRENKNENKKETSIEKKIAVNELIKGVARDMDANAPTRYLIDEDFEPYNNEEIKYHLYSYSADKLSKAKRSLIEKRYGQKLTAEQILTWISNEGEYKS